LPFLETDPPLWLWTQILREYLDTRLADEIRGVLDERINELTRFNERGDLSGELRSRASVAAIELLMDYSGAKEVERAQPLVLLLDDLHWADAASLRV